MTVIDTYIHDDEAHRAAALTEVCRRCLLLLGASAEEQA